MAPVLNTGMPKPALRKLLNASKKGPVGVAVGVGEVATTGLMVLHKVRRGKALEKLLKDEIPVAKNVRFGIASVNVDENPKLVLLSLNRNAPGIAKKLVKTLKGTGYNKVRIVADDGEVEDFEEEDESGPPPALDDEDDDDAAPLAAEGEASPPPPPPAPEPPAAGPSAADNAAKAAQLVKALGALAAGIPKAAGEDAARKATLLKLATDANVQIKTGNLAAAGGFLAQLKAALDAAPAATNGAPAAAAAPASLEAVKIDWQGVRQEMAAEVEKLGAALASTYAGKPYATEVVSRFRAKVDPVVARFDHRLGDAIDGVIAAGDAAQRTAKVTEAKAVLKDYLSFAMTDTVITDLDANPFVPVSIRSKATASLAAVAKAMPA